jgi:acetyl esterase/lipase
VAAAAVAAALMLTWVALGAIGAEDAREHVGRHPATTERRSAAHDETVTVAAAPPAPVVRFTVGKGSRSAAIVRRAGRRGPQPVVIFLHGWGMVGAETYRPWIRHLAATGNTVIIPRYQRNANADPGRVRVWAFAGIRSALARVDLDPDQLIVVGHSAGAALASDYAAVARSSGLPAPKGVFAVYPGRRILGYPRGIPEADPARMPPGTWVTALAGATDTVVGQQPARELVQRARRVPGGRRRLLVVRDPAVSDHYAPARATPSARRAFWRRLDRFMARARS